MRRRQHTINYVHVGGHGIIKDGMVNILCNSSDPKEMKFPLESKLRIMAKQPGAYIILVLDCCRENMREQMRGLGGDYAVADPYDETTGSIILCFTCEAGKNARAES